MTASRFDTFMAVNEKVVKASGRNLPAKCWHELLFYYLLLHRNAGREILLFYYLLLHRNAGREILLFYYLLLYWNAGREI